MHIVFMKILSYILIFIPSKGFKSNYKADLVN